MAETQSGVRIALAAEGAASVDTGLPVLDHLVAQLAQAARFRVSLEVAPGGAEAAAVAAGRAFGAALGERLAEPGAAGSGWSLVPADEALASAALERSDRPLLAANVDFTDQRVGGSATDVVSRFLEELTNAAGLNLHVRVLEGTDSQHVLAAIFKAVGAALGQACRHVPADKEGSS
jgi:imidazoleglycerol phosphate dehydratase HisB